MGSEEFLQLYSPEGIYLIDQNSTIKLKPVDHDIIILKNFYKDLTLIVDPSYYIVEKTNQIPPEHITAKIKREFYKFNENNAKNSVKLVIESEKVNETHLGFDFLNKNYSENGYVPKDIYFELPNGSNVKDSLVKEELIVFLSNLN